MSRPLVLDYLLTRSLDDLMADHGVRLSPGTVTPYKASANYDQIAARDTDPLACECRGLVLGKTDGSPIPLQGPVGHLEVFARPMDRFFNLGQGAAAPFDDGDLLHPEARVMEKVDGTLCIVYRDPVAGAWCVATRSVPDADRPVDGFGDQTFRSLFQLAASLHGSRPWEQFTAALNCRLTYCFELTSPRAGSGVVRYDDHQIHLLAVRHTASGEEVPIHLHTHLPIVADHDPRSIADLRAFVESRPPTEAEGIVLRLPSRTRTGGYHRIKVKSTAYTAAHGLSSEAGASPRNLLRVILAGRWDDVGPICRPHVRDRGDQLAEALVRWCRDLDYAAAMLRAEHGTDRKAFALAVQEGNLPIGPMMAIYTGQVANARGYIDHKGKGGDWGDGFLDNLAGELGA